MTQRLVYHFNLQPRAQMDASHAGEIGLLAHDLNTMHELIPHRNARLEAASHTLQEVDGFDVPCNMEPADGKTNLQDE